MWKVGASAVRRPGAGPRAHPELPRHLRLARALGEPVGRSQPDLLALHLLGGRQPATRRVPRTSGLPALTGGRHQAY